MLRRSFWILAMGVVLLAVTVTAPMATALAANLSTARANANPYNDPNLVSMFDGTLNSWIASKPGGWVAKNGVIQGTGTAGRGWIYYKKSQVGSFRWIFNVRQVAGNHAPTVLIWGSTVKPIRDALSGI